MVLIMKLILLVLLLLMLGGKVSIEAGSVNLTTTTYLQQLGAHKTMLVMFYAPWCSLSRELLPIWEEMAQSMSSSTQDQDIFVGKVDCVAEPDVYWKEDITSFPTVKAFVNYNTIPIIYDGERKANTMWRYFRMLHQQYVPEIFIMDEFAELQETKLSPQKPLALAILNNNDSVSDTSELNLKFDGACKNADRVNCVITRNPDFQTELALPPGPSLTVFSMFNDEAVIDQPITRSDLESTSSIEISQWLLDLSYPPIVELKPENDDYMFSSRRRGFRNHVLVLVKNVNSAEGQRVITAA